MIMDEDFWYTSSDDWLTIILQLVFGFIGTFIGIWLGTRDWGNK